MIAELVLSFFIASVGGYLLGGIPFAYLAVKLGAGKDIRNYGSHNVGATNVYRNFGWKLALAAALGDVAKGAVAVFIVTLLPMANDFLLVTSAVAAVLGHSYSVYLDGSGGKGIATSAGALLVLTPKWLLLLLVIFAVVILLSRGLVSLGSITVAVLYPFGVYLLYPERPVLLIFSILLALLVLFRHISNMERLWRRQETRTRFKRSQGGDDR
jgi:glycerol-3-phosphate acyltransferase PlsY